MDVPESYYLSEEKTQQLLKNIDLSKYRVPENEIGVLGCIDPSGYRQINEVLDPGGISTTLRTFQGGGLQPKILIPRYIGHLPSPAGVNNTLTAGGRHGILIPIREATAQGFADATAYDSVNLALPNSKTRRGRVGKQIANTLDTGCQQGVVIPFDRFTWRIRRLTPRECWRLQAFPDWAFDRAKAAGVSNSQLYKQAGNSVTASVVEVIAMTF
ncbi:hypothetical protein HCJ13_13960 [Listeria booriae]|uniref:DNA cytosine methyltransferase n=1 Tax=Listeria booriae TaxID=1552123 RepID=UPI0016268393|nr:hypothetical protein [Listeria booriae]